MIRKKKKFVRPRKMYEKSRILEENKLVEKYGLKNKREIWKTLAKINYFRGRAKDLVGADQNEQDVLFSKLNGIGLKVDNISDVLALKVEDMLNRRLPSIVVKVGYAKTPREARQMVVHKNVFIDGKVVNIPSYIVSVSEEKMISMKPRRVNAEIKDKEVSSNG